MFISGLKESIAVEADVQNPPNLMEAASLGKREWDSFGIRRNLTVLILGLTKEETIM